MKDGDAGLLVAVVQGPEGVEELLLRTLLAGKELDVVDHQDVGLTVAPAESNQGVVLDGVDELVGELLAAEIDDAGTLLHREDVVADRLEEVGLAETAATIDEEGVVGPGRGVGDGLGGGVCELVVGADNEASEGVGGIHSRRGGGRHLGSLGGLLGGGMFLVKWLGLFGRLVLAVLLLHGAEAEGAGSPVDFRDRRGEEVGVVALDEELVDRIRDTEGHLSGGGGEHRDIAEPTVVAVGADPAANDAREAFPESGRAGGSWGAVVCHGLGWEGTGRGVQGNQKILGEIQNKNRPSYPSSRNPNQTAFYFREFFGKPLTQAFRNR